MDELEVVTAERDAALLELDQARGVILDRLFDLYIEHWDEDCTADIALSLHVQMGRILLDFGRITPEWREPTEADLDGYDERTLALQAADEWRMGT